MRVKSWGGGRHFYTPEDQGEAGVKLGGVWQQTSPESAVMPWKAGHPCMTARPALTDTGSLAYRLLLSRWGPALRWDLSL